MRTTRMTKRGRKMAEDRMHSTCRVQRASGDPVKGPDGELHTPLVTIYEGKCRLRSNSAVTSDIDAAGQLLTGQASVLSLPVATSTEIRIGDLALFIPSADPGDDLDPALLGKTVRVTGLHFDTDATARRLPVQMVS
ncbi:DUF6093 family protein [Curtobacterium sp. Arg-1]|uniref:DUF6093 family protein n=1 Tax=Curtobacterium sp. Arg-1 TaxID=2935040 RepID=UPI0021D9D26B|nr:DUF6093 family protein [Curtobacterium sp. Arg-1]UXZ57087.1 DUF6093 family protein [Curtobacterium sp. Arg-1]